MYKIKTTIELIAPVLYNRPSEEILDGLDKGKTGGKKSIADKDSDAYDKLYKNAKGLYFPASWLKGVIVNGSGVHGLKYGKKALGPYLRATCFIEEREIPTEIKEPDFIDKRPTINRNNQAMVITRRPAIKEGRLITFHIIVSDDTISKDWVRLALEDGGMYKAIGSYRPDFGRFIVKEFEIVKS